MKPTSVTVTVKRTWRTAEYESLSEEVTISAELEESDDHLLVVTQLQVDAYSAIKAHAGPILMESGRIHPKSTQKVAGLKVV